jgi:hypothetical protein
MADFWHCRFRYGQFEILNVTSDNTPTALDSFVTGDITYTNMFDFEEYSGFSEGTVVDTGGAAADAVVIPVPDTTSFVIGQTIAIELDVGTYHKALIDSFVVDTSVTLTVGITSAAGAGNKVVTMNQLSGSTSGSNTQNFKADKVQQIFNKSFNDLEPLGFTHNNRQFPLGVGPSGDDNARFTADYNRDGVRFLAGEAATNLAVLDLDGLPYQFSSGADLNNLGMAFDARQLAIYGGGGGQSGLIRDVTEAGNDQTSMDAITDVRT